MSLLELGYQHVPGFTSVAMAHYMARMMRAAGTYHDYQVPKADSVHLNSPMFQVFHWDQMKGLEAATGKKLAPTVVYGRIYRLSNELKRHTDGGHCEYSITINLAKNHDWPFELEDLKGNKVALELAPGDAVYYLGPQVNHWRKKFKGSECCQMFMHYVDLDGPHAAFAYKWTTLTVESYNALSAP